MEVNQGTDELISVIVLYEHTAYLSITGLVKGQ